MKSRSQVFGVFALLGMIVSPCLGHAETYFGPLKPELTSIRRVECYAYPIYDHREIYLSDGAVFANFIEPKKSSKVNFEKALRMAALPVSIPMTAASAIFNPYTSGDLLEVDPSACNRRFASEWTQKALALIAQASQEAKLLCVNSRAQFIALTADEASERCQSLPR